MQRLIEIIEQENKKNPYTDEAIAQILKMGRSDVVKLRNSLGIENSRKRMRGPLLAAMRDILSKDPALSERALTQRVNDEGFAVSRHAVSEILKQTETRQEKSVIEIIENKADFIAAPVQPVRKQSAFDALIGESGSLRAQVELAKAAILYPPRGLHTMIVGPTGVGKSELAHCMYKFALESGKHEEDFPLVVFNCADYAETPQLLMAQLFGYAKGAFTGADSAKEGLVEKADKGILFLDEIHRLPPEGQEILYYLIDKGKFRRLGESDNYRNVSLMLIAATTENIESFLLLPFRRRIPMSIELPSLEQRSLEERLQIIVTFMREEASRLNLRIEVSYNVVAALLMYNCPGNIGQLYSDIQVACARAFLRHMNAKENNLKIEIGDLGQQIVKGLLHIGEKRSSIDKILQGDLEISPDDQNRLDLIKSSYLLPNDIYQEIKRNYNKMEQQGVDIAVINRIISDELEAKVRRFIKQTQKGKSQLDRQDLEKIVGPQIVGAVERMIQLAKKMTPEIDQSLFYCLATHLAASCERMKVPDQTIGCHQVEKLRVENPTEYRLATQMVEVANDELGIVLPEDEIAFVTMYLKSYAQKEALDEAHVGIVVLSHGRVAEGMVQVANRLLGVQYARSVEMPLEESCESALQRTIEVVKQVDCGKGVLLLTDMGSLVGFGKIITAQTGILTRTVAKVHTPMVMEAIRKALLPDADIDEIANILRDGQMQVGEEIYARDLGCNLPLAIVCVCLTGIGTAKWMANCIKNAMPERLADIELITLGVLGEADLQTRFDELQQQYQLVAVAGTLGMSVSVAPFISSKEILQGEGIEKLRKLIDLASYSNRPVIEKNCNPDALISFVPEHLVVLQKKCTSKREVMNLLAKMLIEAGCVRESYIASVFEREELAPAVFQSVGIPHGNPDFVIQPAIAVMTLAEPVEWVNGCKVDIVFMLALNCYQREVFRKLYSLLNDEQCLVAMKQAKSVVEFQQLLIQKSVSCS